MEKISDLIEQRAKIAAAMREIADKPAGKDGDLSEAQAKTFDGFKTDLDNIEKRIERQNILDEVDRRADGKTILTSGDDKFDAECRQVSLVRAIAYQTDPRSVDAGREIEVSKELAHRAGRATEGLMMPLAAMIPERRVLTVGAGTADQLVQTSVLEAEFIDALRPSSVAIALGARSLTDLRGDIALPKLNALTPVASWFVEDTAITADDHAFSQVPGSPKHLGLLTEYSRKTLLQTSPQIEGIVRADFAAKLGAGIDLAVLKGTGAAGQPTGITATAGINTKSSASAAPTWADVVNTMAAVKAADAPQDSLGWAMNAWGEAAFKRTVKVAAEPQYLMGDGTDMAGAPVATSSQLAGDPNNSPPTDFEVIFGSWGQVIVAFWSGVEILVNPYESTAYSKGNVQVRGIIDGDVLVRHPAAFNHWTDILVS